MRGKQKLEEFKKQCEEQRFFNKIQNIFETSINYEVIWINKDVVKVTDNRGLDLILNKDEIKHIWLQPRIAFIHQEFRDITFYPYKDIITIT